jgi:BMFP domain-containing protein YqiC
MKNNYYQPKDIAEGIYLQGCYKALIMAKRKGEPMASVKNVREDLKKQFSKLSVEEVNSFDLLVQESLEVIKMRTELVRLELKEVRLQLRMKSIKAQLGD